MKESKKVQTMVMVSRRLKKNKSNAPFPRLLYKRLASVKCNERKEEAPLFSIVRGCLQLEFRRAQSIKKYVVEARLV